MENLEGFFSYDQLLVAPLRARGWETSFVPWRSNANWRDYDVVIIRTPWDYFQHPEEFVSVLGSIAEQTRLENPLDIVLWNLDKQYLVELESRGVPIVPTVLTNSDSSVAALRGIIHDWAAGEIILKPSISANASNTHRLGLAGQEVWPFLENHLRTGRWLIQPFIDSVITDGEISLFYFGGQFSHAIRKVPAAGDYRVQEEHGGQLKSLSPDSEALSAADRVMDAVGQDLLYARVDFIRHEDRWLLMELELIEPSLYFNMDPASPERFARVFSDWLS